MATLIQINRNVRIFSPDHNQVWLWTFAPMQVAATPIGHFWAFVHDGVPYHILMTEAVVVSDA